MCNYKHLDSDSVLPFLFFPRSESAGSPPHGAINVDIEVDKGVIIGCRFYIHGKTSPSILYFHGNGETPSEHDAISTFYTDRGWNLLVVTYRGYGWSTGNPTVKNLMDDSKTLFEAVQTRLKNHDHTGPIFVMGRSLGSASAIELASTFSDDIKGLILESSFSDTLPLLQNLGVQVSLLNITEDDGFGNVKKISSIKLPTLIMHGSNDQIITPSSAEKLQAFSGARSKQFHIIPGADHNTMISVGGDLYFETIKKFIDDMTGASNWRNRRKKYRKEKKTAQ